jgi:hypothetical protein
LQPYTADVGHELLAVVSLKTDGLSAPKS